MSSLTGSQLTAQFVDGSVGVHTFTTSAVSLGAVAAATNLRLVAVISILSKNSTIAQITGITDFEGFNWHLAGKISQVISQPAGLTGTPVSQDLEVWYTDTFVSTDLTGGTTYTMTVATDNDVDSVAFYAAVHKDIDTSQPIDQHGGWPATATQMSSSTAVATVSGKTTTTANLQVVVAYCAVGPGQRPGASGDPIMAGDTSPDYGQGDIFHLNQNYNIFGCGIYDTTVALGSATITTKDATNNQLMVVVPFTQDVQAASTHRGFGVVIS